MTRQWFQLAVGGVNHTERVFHGHRLRAFGLDVDVGATEARQDQRFLAMGQVAAIELSADLHGQVAVAQRFEGARAVRRRLGKIAAQTDEDFRAAFKHRVNRFDYVMPVFTRHLELEAFFQRIEKERRWTLVDAHGAVALHVTVAAYRAEPRARLADVAAQQHQVGDLLNGRHRMAMLGDAHRPAHDHVLAFGVHPRSALDVDQRQAGLLDDELPGGVLDHCQIIQHAVGVLVEEGVVKHRRFAFGLGFAFPLQQEFGHATQ